MRSTKRSAVCLRACFAGIAPCLASPDQLTVDWHVAEFDLGGDRTLWMRDREEEARSDGGVPYAWIAFMDAKPVGSVSLIASNMDTRPELKPWLAALFVLPTWRGRGIGSALMERCAAEARTSGFSTLHLYTSEAESYYRRRGWIVIGRERYEDVEVTLRPRAPRLGRQRTRDRHRLA